MPECARSAVSLRDSQFFIDGNHRTAILAIYEYLASVGILLTVDPAAIYIVLGRNVRKGSAADNDALVIELERLMRSKWNRPENGVSEAMRREYADKAKQIPVSNVTVGVFEALRKFLLKRVIGVEYTA
jgi:hypothetical protein